MLQDFFLSTVPIPKIEIYGKWKLKLQHVNEVYRHDEKCKMYVLSDVYVCVCEKKSETKAHYTGKKTNFFLPLLSTWSPFEPTFPASLFLFNFILGQSYINF